MRKFFKTSMLLVLAVVMVFSSAMTCMAATSPRAGTITHSSGIVFVGTGSDKLELSTTYQTIAYVDTSRSTGFGAEIVIIIPDNIDYCANDIVMFDRYGNKIWEEIGAIPFEGIRSFKCGTDVYKVQIRTQSGSGHAYAGFVQSL